MTESQVKDTASRVILSAQNLSQIYGTGPSAVTALDDVSFEICRGEFIAVMGPSGSGKSSLLAMAGGLDTPTQGRVFVDGIAVNELKAPERARLRRRKVGYIFQDYNLVPTLTVSENVSLPLELDGLSARKARRTARHALADVGLEELANRYIDQISGGQAQRVAIARAIVGERALILADEPTGALDSQTGEEIMQVLRRRADQGAAVVLVTHDARHAGWADRVLFMRDGRLVDQTQYSSDPDVLLRDSLPTN